LLRFQAGIQRRNSTVYNSLWPVQGSGVFVPVCQFPLITRVATVDNSLLADLQRKIQPDMAQLGVGRQAKCLWREDGSGRQLTAPGAWENDARAMVDLVSANPQSALVTEIAGDLLEERAVPVVRILPMGGEQWPGPHLADYVFIQDTP